MNPEIHKTLRNELSEDGVLNRRNQGSIKNVLKRFQKDAEEQMYEFWFFAFLPNVLVPTFIKTLEEAACVRICSAPKVAAF